MFFYRNDILYNISNNQEGELWKAKQKEKKKPWKIY